MTPDRWKAIEALFDQAADLAPADRSAFLNVACRQPDGTLDSSLREEVERLLALEAGAETFFGDLRSDLSLDPASSRPVPDAGPWRLIERVGEGGMGEVWRAERSDGAYTQVAAVKLVRPGLGEDLLTRFRAERHVLARLDHPAIARLLDGGTASDGRPYLALEFVDGEPITAYADRSRLSINERLALFREVCAAVAAAHRQLVVHRDLKPSNVLVTDAGQVKLLDFGIAKLLDDEAEFTVAETAADRRVMTPEYAAPEQVRGEPATTATDVYGLGVLLYELLTGARPYRLESRARRAVELAILEAEPTEPSTAVTGATEAAEARATEPVRLKRRLRGDLDQIVLKALRKEPERRYDGAAAFSADLGRHIDGLPVEARPDSRPYRMGRFVRRHRVGVAAAAVTLLAVLGGAGVALWQASEARAAQVRAETEATTTEEVASLLEDLLRDADPGRSRGAEVTVREALDRGAERLQTDLEDKPLVRARLLNVIGTTYAQIGLPSEGLPFVQQALDLRLSVPDSDPAALAQTRHNVAGISLMLGDAVAAEPLLEDAIATWRTLPIGSNPYAWRSYNNMGAIRLQRGDIEGGIEVLSEATRQAQQTEGVDPSLLISLSLNLGKLNFEAGRVQVADSLYTATLAQALRELGDDHPVINVARAGVATTALSLGRSAQAEARFRELVTDLEVRYPEQTVRRSQALAGLGHALLAQEKYEAADRQYSEALRLHAVELPREHAQVSEILTSQADLRLGMDRPAEALALAREADAIQTALGPGRWEAAQTRSVLGAALAATGDRARGLHALRAARDTLVARRGAEDRFTRRSAERLARYDG